MDELSSESFDNTKSNGKSFEKGADGAPKFELRTRGGQALNKTRPVDGGRAAPHGVRIDHRPALTNLFR